MKTRTEGKRAAGEKKKTKKRRLRIDPLWPLPILCFFLFNRDAGVAAALIAAALHEGGHLAALYLCGGRTERVELLPFGGEIVAGGKLLSYPASIAVSLAGPAVNLLSASVLFFSPEGFALAFGKASLGLALFNLLPIRLLDGGSALFDLFSLFASPKTADAASVFFDAVGCVLFLLFALWMLFCGSFGPLPLLLAVYLSFSLITGAKIRRKMPKNY